MALPDLDCRPPCSRGPQCSRGGQFSKGDQCSKGGQCSREGPSSPIAWDQADLGPQPGLAVVHLPRWGMGGPEGSRAHPTVPCSLWAAHQGWAGARARDSGVLRHNRGVPCRGACLHQGMGLGVVAPRPPCSRVGHL